MHFASLASSSLALLLGASLASAAGAATPAELLAGYVKQAGTAASAERGRKLFTTPGGDFDWSCASCHTTDPGQPGKHAVSGKVIKPLAPAFNLERFSNPTQVEFQFKLNCKDVIGRECTSGEKADVLSWLMGFKR